MLRRISLYSLKLLIALLIQSEEISVAKQLIPFKVKYIDKDTLNFVNDVVPDIYKSDSKSTDKGRLLVNDEYTTPLKLIETHKYFDEFRKSH